MFEGADAAFWAAAKGIEEAKSRPYDDYASRLHNKEILGSQCTGEVY